MTARRIIVAGMALLLAAAVVRNSAVFALVAGNPDSAARLWSDHPDVEISRGMVDIALAARAGRPIDQATIAMIYDAALKSPLAAEPFLVRGIRAQLAGQSTIAEQSFAAAELRDPRSLPAHYFLANLYLTAGNGKRGLEELAALSRLAPNGMASVAPFLATFARNRSNWGELRTAFRTHPDIERVALIQLATDASGADAVLALSGGRRPIADAPWITVLLKSLVADGQYARARAIWASASGIPPTSPLLFDAGFTQKAPPPPFNWALTSSTVGLAERQRGGRLHAIFYGNEDGVLARQLLVLPPGAYRFAARVLGDPAQIAPISWTIRCASAAAAMTPISTPVALAQSKGFQFQIPPSCPAEWIELSGSASDMPRQSDVIVSDLSLVRSAPR